jgi:pimeloyl-ACP methyl ester carboxylesterase
MQPHRFAPGITEHRVASSAGVLPARVMEPSMPSHRPPLVVLHGISRNAAELVELFLPVAEHSGRKVVVPHFSEVDWPAFQRPSRAARPDQALLALLARLALADDAFAGPVDLFGHSGGAQLAHRFAMLYPQKVAGLHLAAAGWYCLPDVSMVYPYGIGADATPESLTWARRHGEALPAFCAFPSGSMSARTTPTATQACGRPRRSTACRGRRALRGREPMSSTSAPPPGRAASIPTSR